MLKSIHVVHKVIQYSRYILALSFAAFIVCLLISYPYAEQFSIPMQVGSHILTIVFAGSFKVAVVALMAATKELKTLNVYNEVNLG
jgi:hypothetical protein